jgi:3-methyladenine DNA glycosylase/8-oxoguanine DNA glycosylase
MYDPAEAAAALSAADPVLGAWIARYGACELAPRGMETFPYLLRAITYQQLSGKAAATIHGRVLALTGDPSTPEALLSLPDEALRGAGLSRNKLAAARDLAEKTQAGLIPPLDALHGLADEELVERLTAVRGVGPWTVEMLLIFNLGRPDVLPVTDLGVQKGFSILYGGDGLPSPAMLREHGERWRPWRSVASWYLWRAVDGEP